MIDLCYSRLAFVHSVRDAALGVAGLLVVLSDDGELRVVPMLLLQMRQQQSFSFRKVFLGSRVWFAFFFSKQSSACCCPCKTQEEKCMEGGQPRDFRFGHTCKQIISNN